MNRPTEKLDLNGWLRAGVRGHQSWYGKNMSVQDNKYEGGWNVIDCFLKNYLHEKTLLYTVAGNCISHI